MIAATELKPNKRELNAELRRINSRLVLLQMNRGQHQVEIEQINSIRQFIIAELNK